MVFDSMHASQPSADPLPDRRTALAGVRSVVVKVGTNVLSRESGEMALGRIHAIIEELVDLKRRGLKVILVTSGAISMGMHRLGLEERPTFLRDKQACAAVGQIRLMAVYLQAFESFDIPTAQILLTEDDFANRKRYLNLRNTMSRLLELGVLPIINENDSVSTSEIEEPLPRGGVRQPVFGDNDMLSALVVSKLGADLLLLLSDVEGLYPLGPPAAEADSGEPAAPLGIVREITSEVKAMAGKGNARGRGGMASKLQAIQIAVQSGALAVIASGSKQGTIHRVLAGEEVGTLFLPRRRLQSRKRWIAFASAPEGRILVNAGAREALLKRRSSLLFAGVIGIEADFERGDVVSIVGEDGKEFARGISNYAAELARPLAGKRSEEIPALAGRNFEELITRDNIVVME
jgi:glutamate 5-kinase